MSALPRLTSEQVAHIERARRQLMDQRATDDLREQIEQRQEVPPMFMRHVLPGHRHYAVCDDGSTRTTVQTYAVDGGDAVAMALSSAAGDHYSVQRFSAAKARALAAELIAAADSLDAKGSRT